MKPKAAHLIAVAGWGVAACACLEAWHQHGRAEALKERLFQELRHPAAPPSTPTWHYWAGPQDPRDWTLP